MARRAATRSSKSPAARHVTQIELELNGRVTRASVPDHWTLLEFLRKSAGLTGAKEGCNAGECGACTVLLDGVAVYACCVLAAETSGKRVMTIEGLGTPEQLAPLQEAFLADDALQCGFCIPGQIMAAKALLDTEASPDREGVRRALSGNLCRCGCYVKIATAVLRAAAARREPGR
jgi:aerobic-type carbon monoxide dehydrogenase small subunit (CoxS/CutS family)